MARRIELDRSTPFVRAVFDTAADELELDAAVAVLVDAERRHGVRVIHDPVCGSLADTWVPRAGAPATVGEFLTLLRSAPTGLGDPADWTSFRATTDVLYDKGDDDACDEAALCRFLDETSLLLGGTDFANDHWIVTPGGVLNSWTQRAWGEQLARWLKTSPLRARPGWRQLDKVDLTYSLYAIVQDYDRWSATCFEILRRKCQLQLDEALA